MSKILKKIDPRCVLMDGSQVDLKYVAEFKLKGKIYAGSS